MSDWIDELYEPADGRPDDWKCGLIVDGGGRLEQYAAESPVLALIQSAGKHLFTCTNDSQRLGIQWKGHG